MTKASLSSRLVEGDVILDRLAEVDVPALLSSPVSAFGQAHQEFKVASESVRSAEERRDAALAQVGKADGLLDVALDDLATELVAAKLGPRKNPFAPFSKHSPSDLRRLGFRAEADAAQELAAEISKAGPPANVSKAVGDLLTRISSVRGALVATTPPEAAYDRALADRNEALVGWQKARTRLEVLARAAWADAPEIFRSVFAPPPAVQAPRKARRKAAGAAA